MPDRISLLPSSIEAMVKIGTYSENFDAIFRRPTPKPALQKFSATAARKTSVNPYFRDMLLVKGGASYYSPEFALEKSRERARVLAAQRAALRKLRVYSKDRGKLVFYKVKRVGKKFVAKRVRGKSLLQSSVYVLKAGKKRFKILNTTDPRTIAKGVKPQPSPQRLDSMDLRKIRMRPVDFKKFLLKTERIFKKRFITGPITKQALVALKTTSTLDKAAGISYYTVSTPRGILDPFYKSAIAIWNRLVQGQRKQMRWRLDGRLLLADGRWVDFHPDPLDSSRFYDITSAGLVRAVGKTRKAKRVYSTPFMYDLYSKYLHTGIKDALATLGIVSLSSIRRIASKSYNIGKPMSEWQSRTTRGAAMEWPGKDKTPVAIVKISFTFSPARI